MGEKEREWESGTDTHAFISLKKDFVTKLNETDDVWFDHDPLFLH